jgi:imidazolonepropionase-like amidohydrolase
LVLGTDVGRSYLSLVPGFAVHDELERLVECGLSPFETLRTCTVKAAEVARRMTGKGNFGTVAPGQRADLLLVEGNPLEDLSVLRHPAGVMAAGRWLPRSRLDGLLAIRCLA